MISVDHELYERVVGWAATYLMEATGFNVRIHQTRGIYRAVWDQVGPVWELAHDALEEL